jgi:DNA-binding CsgD family transcriptional regulator
LAQSRAAGRAFDRGDLDRCAAVLARQRAAAEGDPMAELVALTGAALMGALAGELRRARTDLAAAEQRLTALGAAGLGPHWEQAALACDWMGGDWASAEERTARLEALPPVPPTLTLSLRVELLRQAGRPDEADGAVRRLGTLPPSALTAWAVSGVDPEPSHALARLRAAVPAAWTNGHVGMLPLVLYRTADHAFRAGDDAAVGAARAEFTRLNRADPLARILTGMTEALASKNARPTHAARELAAAEDLSPLVAECLTIQGRLGDHPDRSYRAALAHWRSIGARPRATELATLTGEPPDTDQSAVRLAPRERELVRLVRDGRTNREIAAAMHLSVKSVEAYLTRVYTKTGCASRVELALAAAQNRYPGPHPER